VEDGKLVGMVVRGAVLSALGERGEINHD
jgi:hypothetical protein